MDTQEILLVHKLSKLRTADDKESAVLFLTSSVASFLADEIEELNTNATIFRSGLQRCILGVLAAISSRTEEQFFIFPNSVPGFTLIVMRKNDNFDINSLLADKAAPKNIPKINNKSRSANGAKNSSANDNKAANNKNKRLDDLILERIISNFFKKNEEKILLVENTDISFAFFPLADTRKNLKELELYITY